MIYRLCLKDKSSVLIEANIVDININVKKGELIEVTNHNTKKTEYYNKDFVWCIRESSQN